MGERSNASQGAQRHNLDGGGVPSRACFTRGDEAAKGLFDSAHRTVLGGEGLPYSSLAAIPSNVTERALIRSRRSRPDSRDHAPGIHLKAKPRKKPKTALPVLRPSYAPCQREKAGIAARKHRVLAGGFRREATGARCSR